MKNSYSESYKKAGVDITAGYKAVELMKGHIARTMNAGALGAVGGFGGMFEPDLTGIKTPVLVSGTDGVGTKLKLAFLMDKHDTVGIDCVAMCVNDVVCLGGRPLIFLDYIALGKNVPERVAEIVSGVAEGCVQAGCALIGGETAEMPGMYDENEYDLAGYTTGIVDKEKVLNPENVQAGDAIVAVASSGVHSNGFSLVRKALDVENRDLTEYIPEFGATLGETLLTPTKIYVKPVLKLLETVNVRSIAHITGGGFYENIPRAFGSGLCAVIDEKAIVTPPVFEFIQKSGDISRRDMFNTFNMGVGLSAIVPAEQADEAVRILNACGEKAYILGHIEKAADEGKVRFQ